MSKEKKNVLALLILVLTLSLVIVYNGSRGESIPTTMAGNAQFVLAEWDYPDEYGQGIYGFRFYENSTGSWVAAPFYAWVGDVYGEFYFLHSYDSYTLNWSEGVAMKLRAYNTFNNTLVGAIDEADGQNYLRHSVTVASAGTTVFSQQNFTYFDVTDWYYEYEVVLNFLPVGGEIYTITIDYDIFYSLEGSINHTMHFETVDPYDGYDTWTFDYTGGTQEPIAGRYRITTNTNGYTQYLGYDEFSNQNDIMAEVLFNPTVLAGTYRYQPIHYVYQKTGLQIGTRTALSLLWHSGGLRLDWNTGNGDTPTPVALVATAPIAYHEYSILLANSGNDTWVRVYDYDTSSVVYNGTTTTFNYDATTLYAGLGQYSGGDGGITGRWDNFTVAGFALPASWNTVSAAILLFAVSFDMWGFDTGLIILGLVMIPVSMLYLAYGVKHDRSSDRLFYGLIMFFLGCGLFIGGVLP